MIDEARALYEQLFYNDDHGMRSMKITTIAHALAAARAEERRKVWREAVEKVAQDFHDTYGRGRVGNVEIGLIEVQAFLDSRIVHYPECRQQAQENGKVE